MSWTNDMTVVKKANSLWQLTLKMRSILFASGEDKFEEPLIKGNVYDNKIFDNCKLEHYIESDILIAILIYKVLREKNIQDNIKIKDIYFKHLSDSIINIITKLSILAFSKNTIIESTDEELILALNNLVKKGRVLTKDKYSNREIDLYTPSLQQLRKIKLCKRLPSIRKDLSSFINERLKFYSEQLSFFFKNSDFLFNSCYLLYENPLAYEVIQSEVNEYNDFLKVLQFMKHLREINLILEWDVPAICDL